MDLDIRLRKIVVPTDFSDNAKEAFRHAAAIARWSGAELIVLHVVEKFMDHSLLYSDVWPFQKPLREYYRELEERTEERLARNVKKAVGPDIEFRVVVTTGVPSSEIVSLASREAADLIVIAPQGRGGLAQTLLGSTTDRVLRKARCPILLVRTTGEGATPPN